MRIFKDQKKPRVLKKLDEVEIAKLDLLRTIWKQKEFRFIPTPVLDTLRSNPNLDSESCWLWVYLFEQAYFDENWEVKVSRKQMSQVINKSVRVVSSHIKALVTQGYLISPEEYGCDTPSYYVRLPQAIAEHIMFNYKDRKTGEVEEANELVIIDKSNLSKQKSLNQWGVTQICNPPLPKSARGVADLGNPTNNNINNKYINNNNTAEVGDEQGVAHLHPPTVVVGNELNGEILTGSDELAVARSQVEKLDKKIKAISHSLTTMPTQKKMAALRQISALTLQQSTLAERIETVSSQAAQREVQQQVNELWKLQPKYMFLQPGERQLTEFQYHRLRKQLSGLGYLSEKVNELVNQIIYEIRFGTLKFKQGTSTILPLDHAISIAMKLVREKRWGQPQGMVEYGRRSIQ